MAILFHARSLKEQLSLLNFIDKQFLINNYRINFINNQLSIDEFHAKRLHSEVFFRMKNLFCGPLGVQNFAALWECKILRPSGSAKFILRPSGSAKFILRLDFLDITVFLASSYGIGAFPKKVISINRAFAK